MKKTILITSLIVVCMVLFASCGVDKPVGDEASTTEKTAQTTVEATQESAKTLTPEELQQVEAVEKVAYKLAMATTVEEVKSCVIECDENYADYVLEGFPDDDYIIEVERLVEYKDTIAFYITVTCECNPEWIYSGVQLFSYNDDGELLINLDEETVEQFCKDFACDACNGKGYTVEKAQTSGADDKYISCEVCKEYGFDFSKEIK